MDNTRTATAIVSDLNLLIEQMSKNMEEMRVTISRARTIRRNAKKTMISMEKSLNKKKE